jgi:hypothetical protein
MLAALGVPNAVATTERAALSSYLGKGVGDVPVIVGVFLG